MQKFSKLSTQEKIEYARVQELHEELNDSASMRAQNTYISPKMFRKKRRDEGQRW